MVPAVSAWIPAIGTSALLGFALFVSKAAFKAEIEKSIAHKYDHKLEAVKSDLRKSEEALKAEIKSRDDQLNALRSGVLSGFAARQSALGQRRLSAIEILWSSVVGQNSLKPVNSYVTYLKLDNIAKEINGGGRDSASVERFMDLLWKSLGLEGYTITNKALSERPFIPALIWGLYTARYHILTTSFTRFAMAKYGFESDGMLEVGKLLETAKAALPHQAPYIDKYGIDGLPLLVEEIEQRLLNEIDSSLRGEEADAHALEQAHAIIKKADDMLTPGIPNPEIAADLRRFAAEPPPQPPASR